MMLKRLRTDLIFRVLLWAAAVAAAQGVPAAAAQSPEPKTVGDFFLLIPESYVGYDLRFREELLRGERRGAVIDTANGYISWDASDNPEQFEFAIFRKSNGRYLVAYSVGYDSQFPDASRFLLLSYEGGRWRDVTRATLPVAVDRRKTYKLPRRGRTIEVTDEWGHKSYSLTWRGDRFHFKRAARR